MIKFKPGEAVKVKPKTWSPELKLDISGWQGRIVDTENNQIIGVNWDSKTLKKIPDSEIKYCEQQGLSWHQFYLDVTEIEPTIASDTLDEVDTTFCDIQAKFFWVHLGDAGERIGALLAGTSDDSESLNRWYQYLQEKLIFSFIASAFEHYDNNPITREAQVKVKGFNTLITDDILMDIEYQKKCYAFPLSGLAVIDITDVNYRLIQDYVIWHANR